MANLGIPQMTRLNPRNSYLSPRLRSLLLTRIGQEEDLLRWGGQKHLKKGGDPIDVRVSRLLLTFLQTCKPLRRPLSRGEKGKRGGTGEGRGWSSMMGTSMGLYYLKLKFFVSSTHDGGLGRGKAGKRRQSEEGSVTNRILPTGEGSGCGMTTFGLDTSPNLGVSLRPAQRGLTRGKKEEALTKKSGKS